MIIAYICLFFLSYFDSESHIGGPSPAGVAGVVVTPGCGDRCEPEGMAIDANPKAWRSMRSPGESPGRGPGFGARKSITVLHVSID